MSTSYWRGQTEDEEMQDEHVFIWKAMLNTIDVDVRGRRVLDVGCNQGGFLRLLVDDHGIKEGYGYDPASAAIDDARRLAGGRPLTFEAADTVPEGWSNLDVAFSHEVMYLIADLGRHARALFGALAPGGVYFAVMGVHAGSPLMVEWHTANAGELHLPPLHDVDGVVATFAEAGFDVSVARLAMRFVPAAGRGHDHTDRLLEWLTYYCEHKLLCRFARPR